MVFETLTARDGLKDTSFVVLLSKIDLFPEAMTEYPISDYYPEYSYGQDCLAACRFFAEKFCSRDDRLNTPSEGERPPLRIHVINAVDREAFALTMGNVQPNLLGREETHLAYGKDISRPTLHETTSKLGVLELKSIKLSNGTTLETSALPRRPGRSIRKRTSLGGYSVDEDLDSRLMGGLRSKNPK